MSLRVLHVIPSFAGGGAEGQILLLAGALAQRGIPVHIAYLHGGPYLAMAQACGAELHHLETLSNYDLRVIFQLVRLIRTVRPSVVQTWLLHADVAGGLAAKILGVPWILSERSSEQAYSSGLKYAVRRRLGRHASAIIANSEAGLQYWKGAGFRGLAFVVRNIVAVKDDGRPLPGEPRAAAACGPDSLLIVGRLTDEKNPGGVLDVLEKVFSTRQDTCAEFFGTGPLGQAIMSRVERTPTLAGRVHLHGYVSDLVPWFRGARALFSLSRFEGTPNAVLEAMSEGCPIIVSDIPEHREFVDADCGWLVPLDSPHAAAEAICSVLDQPQEAALRARRARERVAGLSPIASAVQHEDIYTKVSGKSPDRTQ